MHESQLRWMIGLSLVVLALVAALGWDDPGAVDPADPDATGVVWSLPDLAAVSRIEREVKGERLVLVREANGWRMESPDVAEADADIVERFLDDLRELDKGVPVDVGTTPDADFGLGEPPAARVRLTVAGEVKDAVYGDPAPVGYRTYARDASGAVVAVGGRSELLFEPASAFRDHHVLRLDPAAVRSVTLDHDGHHLVVSGQGTRWWVAGFTRADPDRVDDLIMGLLDLRFDRVMNLGGPIAEPRSMVTLGLADGTTHEIRVGERTPMGDVVDGPMASGFVFPESLALLAMGPTDLGDRRAVPLEPDRADRVTLVTDGATWEATRNGPTWSSVDRDPTATAARVNALAQASIAYRMEPVEAPASVVATVTVWVGEDRRSVEFGPEVDGFHAARDVDGGAPYRVRAAELGALDLR